MEGSFSERYIDLTETHALGGGKKGGALVSQCGLDVLWAVVALEKAESASRHIALRVARLKSGSSMAATLVWTAVRQPVGGSVQFLIFAFPALRYRPSYPF